MSKKSFRSDAPATEPGDNDATAAARAFITQTQEQYEAQQAEKAARAEAAKRNSRTSVFLKPETRRKLERLAVMKQSNLNATINDIIETYLANPSIADMLAKFEQFLDGLSKGTQNSK